MQSLMCIVVVFFTILNLILYHKVFTVYYFSLGHGLAKELGASVCVAIIETALVFWIGGYILIFFGVVIVIALIVKAVKKHTNTSEEPDQAGSTDRVHSSTGTKPVQKNISKDLPKTEKKPDNSNAEERNNPANVEKKPATVKTKDVTEGENPKIISEKMFCPYCGEKISRTAKFCNFCGKSNSYGK